MIPSLVRLSEHVRALRHGALGPGGPDVHGAAADLFHDVLGQPDEADPVEWLRSHRSVPCATLALGLALKVAIELRHPRSDEYSEVGFPRGRGDHDSDLHVLFGELATHDARSLSTDWDRAASLEEALSLEIESLVRLRRASALMPAERPNYSRAEPGLLTLLADLLRLPADAEPLRWLISERLQLCSVVALRYLVGRTIPPIESVDRRTVVRRVRSDARCRSTRGLEASVKEILEHPGGFTVHVEAMYSAPRECATPAAWCDWEGFERVFDSQGRYYLARPLERQSVKMVWPPGTTRRRQALVLLCAPSLAAGVLTFESPSAALAIYRAETLAGQLVPEPLPNLGPIACTVEV